MYMYMYMCYIYIHMYLNQFRVGLSGLLLSWCLSGVQNCQRLKYFRDRV